MFHFIPAYVFSEMEAAFQTIKNKYILTGKQTTILGQQINKILQVSSGTCTLTVQYIYQYTLNYQFAPAFTVDVR